MVWYDSYIAAEKKKPTQGSKFSRKISLGTFSLARSAMELKFAAGLGSKECFIANFLSVKILTYTSTLKVHPNCINVFIFEKGEVKYTRGKKDSTPICLCMIWNGVSLTQHKTC